MRTDVESSDSRAKLGVWTGTILDRVTTGITRKHYKLIPTLEDAKLDPETLKPAESCLFSVLRPPSQEKALVWIDDRFVTAYQTVGQIPIIGINDILRILRDSDTLPDDEYYDLLVRLRAGNFRFIPVTKEEIVYQLRQANVIADGVVETKGLRVLRRYVAGCFSSPESLQRPPMPEGTPNPSGEIGFALSLNSAVLDALLQLWKDGGGSDECQARCAWLLKELLYEHRLLIDVAYSHTATIGLPAASALFCSTMLGHAAVADFGGEDTKLRRELAQWLFAAVVRPRLEAEPGAPQATCSYLKQYFRGLDPDHLDRRERQVAMVLHQKMLRDLPELIRRELEKDSEFMSEVGLRLIAVTELDGVRFAPRSPSEY